MFRASASILTAALVIATLTACGSRATIDEAITISSSDQGPGFDPAMLIVRGRSGSFRVTNSLDKDHGFSIEGLNVEKVIPAGQTMEVELDELKPIDYEYFCQLHDLKTEKGQHRRGILRVGP